MPNDRQKLIRPRRLNLLSKNIRKPVSYLEIGVNRAETMVRVKANRVVGVDPSPQFDVGKLSGDTIFFGLTSDDFFLHHAQKYAFNLIFLDGLHEWRQTLRDLQNSLRFLVPGGFIVLDDVVPSDAFSADPDPTVIEKARALGLVDHGRWYGDVFKVVRVLYEHRNSIDYVTVGGASGVHGQTIVWKKHPGVAELNVSASLLETLENLTYDPPSAGEPLPEHFQHVKESRFLYRKLANRARKAGS